MGIALVVLLRQPLLDDFHEFADLIHRLLNTRQQVCYRFLATIRGKPQRRQLAFKLLLSRNPFKDAIPSNDLSLIQRLRFRKIGKDVEMI